MLFDIKPEINANIARYGEFLCEDFFVKSSTFRGEKKRAVPLVGST